MKHKIFSIRVLSQYRYQGLALDFFSDTFQEFKFRELIPDDFSNHAVFEIKNRRSRYLDHLKNGHRCFAFENNRGDIVAYFWLTFGDTVYSRPVPIFRKSTWLLTEGEAYIWDCRTIDAYRQRGLYKEGLNRLVYLCQQQNVMNIMMSSHASNQASNAGIMSVGFTYHGKVHFVGAGRFKLIFCQGKRPKFSRVMIPVMTTDVVPCYVLKKCFAR